MKTPYDEMLERVSIVSISQLESRATYIKALWCGEVINAPPGALDGPDGQILELETDRGETITYEKRTYGGKAVIEAEGVIVCRLIS